MGAAMNGAEHYREAERIAWAAQSDEVAHQQGFSDWSRGDLAALAQVHATLALAGITDALDSRVAKNRAVFDDRTLGPR
jgi:hypothetical protein